MLAMVQPPPQKKVCTRNEPRISTFTGFFQGFFRYCAQKLSGMFHPQSLANHPDHQSSQEDSYSHSSINSTQEDVSDAIAFVSQSTNVVF